MLCIINSSTTMFGIQLWRKMSASIRILIMRPTSSNISTSSVCCSCLIVTVYLQTNFYFLLFSFSSYWPRTLFSCWVAFLSRFFLLGVIIRTIIGDFFFFGYLLFLYHLPCTVSRVSFISMFNRHTGASQWEFRITRNSSVMTWKSHRGKALSLC